MPTAKPGPEYRLEVRRRFSAPREAVFRAWTERNQLEQWMCRDEATHDVRYTELELRVGGRYTMRITAPGGVLYILGGVFREVTPPKKLAFTWSWKKTPAKPGELNETDESLVMVEFVDRGDQTEVVLTHELTPNSGPREGYDKGWNGCFDLLEKVFAGRGKA